LSTVCGNTDILKIFGYTSDADIETVVYVNYLIMARAGLRALEFYSPEVHQPVGSVAK
jgi:dipeptidyl-peptidase-3